MLGDGHEAHPRARRCLFSACAVSCVAVSCVVVRLVTYFLYYGVRLTM